MGRCLWGKSNHRPPPVILTLLIQAWRLVINPGQHKLEMFLSTGNKLSAQAPREKKRRGLKYFLEIRCSNLECALVKPNYRPPPGNAIQTELYFTPFFSPLPHSSQVGVRGERWLFIANRRRPGEDELLRHARWQIRSRKQSKEHPTYRETMNNGEPTNSASSPWLMKLIKVSMALATEVFPNHKHKQHLGS